MDHDYHPTEGFVTRSQGISFTSAIILFILCGIGLWKIFIKGGKPGWPGIIPIYSTIVLLQIVGKPIWWILLYFVPILNIIIYVIVSCRLGDCFNKSTGFKIGLILLPFIFLIILGFDQSEYAAPSDAETEYSNQ